MSVTPASPIPDDHWYTCPFCGGRFGYGESGEHVPFLMHISPECETFRDLEITDYLHAVNVALGQHN